MQGAQAGVAAEPSGAADPWGAEALSPGFSVRLEHYEGPLHLLLTLIRRERLAIDTLALASVTGQYLAYLGRLDAVDPRAVAAFCEVASTLMLIKSRSLLPRPPVDDATDEEAMDLVERLRAFKRFRAAAERLGSRERVGLRAFVRSAGPPTLTPDLRAGELDVRDLAAAFQRALAEARAAEAAAAATSGPVMGPPRPRVRLSERFREIKDLLRRQGRVTFREALFGARIDREYVLVSFLAVLELLRRRVVRATQDTVFGDIALEARTDFDGWGTDISDDAFGEDL